jgi:hypothetical protein
MSAHLSRPALVVAAVAAFAGVALVCDGGLQAVADQPDPAQQLVTGVRQAAEEHDFSGTLDVTWSDAAGAHSRAVFVRSTGGVLALGDHGQVIVDGPRRFVHATDDWYAVWSQQLPDLPSPSGKWVLSMRDGPPVAGRTTQEVDAADRDQGRVRERLYFDTTTGLLLRREQLAGNGTTVRAVSFTSISETAGAPFGVVPPDAPRAPRSSLTRQPRVLDKVAAPFRAPSTAGDRFRLVGRYRDATDTVHLFYSDGLFGVSVFQQAGKLDWSGLPAGGEARTVAGHDARRYQTPGATVTVWESDHVVYTAVADAPADQVDRVLADFGPPPSPSALDRVTDFLLGPFDW